MFIPYAHPTPLVNVLDYKREKWVLNVTKGEWNGISLAVQVLSTFKVLGPIIGVASKEGHNTSSQVFSFTVICTTATGREARNIVLMVSKYRGLMGDLPSFVMTTSALTDVRGVSGKELKTPEATKGLKALLATATVDFAKVVCSVSTLVLLLY